MTEQHMGIKVGDRVRARTGTHEGKVGTALRVVVTRDVELSSDKVLIRFSASEAAYLDTESVEIADNGEE